MAAAPANAETVISTAVTTPQSTSASGDIRISSTGSVKPTSGTASPSTRSNYVSQRRDDPDHRTPNNSDGQSWPMPARRVRSPTAAQSRSTRITRRPTPIVTATSTVPLHKGTNRFGIHVLGGGTFTGRITNSGSITVEGNQSAGIAVDSTLAGSLTMIPARSASSATTASASGPLHVTGNVSLINGTITVQGGNSVGVAINGDVGGTVSIQNGIRRPATGRRRSRPTLEARRGRPAPGRLRGRHFRQRRPRASFRCAARRREHDQHRRRQRRHSRRPRRRHDDDLATAPLPRS